MWKSYIHRVSKPDASDVDEALSLTQTGLILDDIAGILCVTFLTYPPKRGGIATPWIFFSCILVFSTNVIAIIGLFFALITK